MHRILSKLKKLAAINKLLLSLLVFVLILVFYMYVLIRIRNKYMLIEEVGYHLRTRLIEAGVSPHISIEHEILRTDTMLFRFYMNRTFQPAWINNKGPLTLADSLFKAVRSAYHEGLNPDHYHVTAIEALLDSIRADKKKHLPFDIERISDLDLLLSDAYLLYGSHLLSGHIDPETIDPAWMTKHPESDMVGVLEGALRERKIQGSLMGLLPSFPYYQRLRDELGRYRSIAWRGGWPIVPEGPTMKRGDEGYRVAALRARLAVSGDYQLNSFDENVVFDSTLEHVVRRFQKKHGLEEDGSVGYETRLAMNVPALHYVRTLAANMERWRWLPRDLGDRYILVNIAAYELLAMEFGRPVRKMRVVVGKDYRQTPTFSGTMTHLVLNPYWKVPVTIAREDILPKIQNDPDYLATRNIEVFTDWSSETPIDPDSIDWVSFTKDSLPYHFRQAPGLTNSLGRIKFMFPNKYDVYLHDTPERNLFEKRQRAFSSGCIRVEDPEGLAEYVLNGDSTWSRGEIERVLGSDENRTIMIPKPIPVYIIYCTAWAHLDGSVYYLKDIYDRDGILENAMRLEAFLPY